MATANDTLVNRRGIVTTGIASFPHLHTAVAFNSATNRSEDVTPATAAVAAYTVDLYLDKEEASKIGKLIKECFEEDQKVKEQKGAKLVPAALAGKDASIINRPLVPNNGGQDAFPVDEYPAVLKLKLKFQTASGTKQRVKLHDCTSGTPEAWSEFTDPIQGGDKLRVKFTLGKGYTGGTGGTNGYPTYLDGVGLLERQVIEIASSDNGDWLLD